MDHGINSTAIPRNCMSKFHSYVMGLTFVCPGAKPPCKTPRATSLNRWQQHVILLLVRCQCPHPNRMSGRHQGCRIGSKAISLECQKDQVWRAGYCLVCGCCWDCARYTSCVIYQCINYSIPVCCEAQGDMCMLERQPCAGKMRYNADQVPLTERERDRQRKFSQYRELNKRVEGRATGSG